jgi:hypothetical protein
MTDDSARQRADVCPGFEFVLHVKSMKEAYVKVVSKADNKMGGVVAIAERLVRREQANTRSRMRAYEKVASQVGRSGHWLRKLLSSGDGRIDVQTASKLDALLIRGLEADLARLSAELEMARQSGSHPCSAHVGQIEAHIAQARALLNGRALDSGE